MTTHQNRGLKLKVKYISRTELSDIADRFLSENGHSEEVPINIEGLYDKLEIRIIAVPGLKRALQIDAYISSDFKSVVIDEECFTRYESRARFSLAHELGHSILHKELYSAFEITSMDQYSTFQSLIGQELEKRIENQAQFFAGYLLVPKKTLEVELNRLVSEYGGVESLTLTSLGEIIESLASTFSVSNEVIFRRIRSDYEHIYLKADELAK